MSIGLSLTNVGRTFQGPAGAVVALEDVDLTVAPGELISLVGPSGCGKSTLLRAVAGLDREFSGEILADGIPIRGPDLTRGIIFQEPRLFPWLTLVENVGFGLRSSGKARAERIQDLVSLVGLSGFERAYPHQLSGGMAQRVALARALVNHPRVLLLDEPLGALDAFTRMRMQDEVLRLWQARGTTMLLVTHDVDEAIYMSDRIVIMTPRPGHVERIIPVDLERPRQRNAPEFLRMRANILELLHFAGKADGV